MPHYTESWTESWSLWRNAWRELPDNPLNHYIRAGFLRREQRISPRQRLLVLLGIVIVSIAGLWFLEFFNGSGPRDTLALLWFLLSSLTYIVWLANGFNLAVREGLCVLSQPGQRTVALQLDDMLCLTRLSDQDILLAALYNIGRILLPRVLAAALLLTIDMLLLTLLSGPLLESNTLFPALLLSPLSILSLFISGMLGAMISGLWLICAGRGLPAERLSGLAALFLLLSNAGWFRFAYELIKSGSSDADSITLGGSQMLGAGLALLFVYLACLLAELRYGLRLGFAVLGPATLPLALALLFLLAASAQMYTGLSGNEPAWSAWLSGDVLYHAYYSYLRSWGACCLVNPLVLPSPLCWGESYNDFGGSFSPLWLNLPATIVTQLGIAVVLSQFALRAVELRRRGD